MILRGFRSFVSDRTGATAIEYGLMLACIVVALIVGITAVGKKSGAMYEDLDAKWEAAEKG